MPPEVGKTEREPTSAHNPTTEQDDRALMCRVICGEEVAWEEICRRYRDRIYWHCFKYLCNACAAADATQNTLIRAFQGIHTFDPSRPFKCWVFAIADRQCVDQLRRRARRPAVQLADSDAVDHAAVSPGVQVADENELARLRTALDGLSPEERAVVLLDWPNRQIAEILEIPYNTVLSRRYRAIRKLRIIMDVHEDAAASKDADGEKQTRQEQQTQQQKKKKKKKKQRRRRESHS